MSPELLAPPISLIFRSARRTSSMGQKREAQPKRLPLAMLEAKSTDQMRSESLQLLESTVTAAPLHLPKESLISMLSSSLETTSTSAPRSHERTRSRSWRHTKQSRRRQQTSPSSEHRPLRSYTRQALTSPSFPMKACVSTMTALRDSPTPVDSGSQKSKAPLNSTGTIVAVEPPHVDTLTPVLQYNNAFTLENGSGKACNMDSVSSRTLLQRSFRISENLEERSPAPARTLAQRHSVRSRDSPMSSTIEDAVAVDTAARPSQSAPPAMAACAMIQELRTVDVAPGPVHLRQPATDIAPDQTTTLLDTYQRLSVTTQDQTQVNSGDRHSTSERRLWCRSTKGPAGGQYPVHPQGQLRTQANTVAKILGQAPLKERTVMEDHTETTGEAGLTSIISTDMSRPTTMEDSAMMGPPPTSQFTPLAKARNDRSHLRLATDPTKHHIPVKSYPIYPMSRNAVSSIERSTARTNCVRRDPAAETTVSEHDVLVESSPVSPTLRDSGSELGSDDRGYETPSTSPESSPLKSRPFACRFPRLDKVIPQLDGDRGSVQEALAEDDEPIPPAYTRACAEHDIQSTLNLLADNEHALSKMEVPTSRARLDAQTPVDADDETPQVTASPAKGATAFPFPRQLMSRLSMPFIAKQRQPSALLKYCERNATTRQRRLMTDSLRTPDRFISSRPRTPTKDNMVFAQTAAMPSPLAGYGGQRIVEADPFAPPPRRSICMAEQHATLRGPPVRTREVGRAASRVDAPSAAEQRAVSEGGIWHVGGSIVAEGITSTPNGRGGRVTSGTCAPHYTADFLRKTSATEEEVKHGRRLALAMDIDQGAKMLDHSSPSSTSPGSSSSPQSVGGRVWRDSAWEREGSLSPTKASEKKAKDIPVIPFRVLNAPALRDDYYCSLLAYSPTLSCLAVGLGPHVYLWSEAKGTSRANIPDSLTAPFASHVTSIFFSSAEGGSAILAIGRADGKITLWSPLDKEPRFDSEQPSPVSCVCFRPSIVRRPSVREPSMPVTTEELLVGDEEGHVYFYAIEWPTQDQRDLFAWHGSMTLLARIACHTQQVCGLAWSPDGDFFATGGNDNQLFLFETKKILKPAARSRGDSDATVNVRSGDDNSSDIPVTGQGEVLSITPGQERHVFALNAAVKAIAFAPWQPSLIAAGGGSNDRCIHFFHTFSGAALATIDCHAQVTSLIWSEQRREIAATFGFAQPEHSYRVAVFTWPRCRMVVGIPWYSEERALYAVAYPKGPLGGVEGRQSGDAGRVDSEGRPWYGKRTREEGCLVVATSDASIKFHEIWPEKAEGKKSAVGWLGGSQILEGECSFEMERSSAIR